MKIKYTAPCLDYSGYGECSRHDVASLTGAGVNVTTQIPNYTLEHSDYGSLGELCRKLENRALGYQVKIIHTTPNTYPLYFEDDKYHIGRVFWETDKLPLDFSKQVEKCDEIWTGSEYNKKAIENAGVTKPIYIIPEAIDTSIDFDKVKPYITEADPTYKFYSMFEWTERKNPEALLTAYWQEFTNGEKVSLTIKTYLDNFQPRKKAELDQKIRVIKKGLRQDKFAPAYIYRQLMDRHQIYRFHKTFDCFVSAHRGEGWGIPQMEAMLMGKPIISTGCGGIHEYISKKEGVILPYKLVSITGEVRNPQWYRGDQKWADVSVKDLRKAMRSMYENKKKGVTMGKNARDLVLKSFSTKAVGKIMKHRLEAIHDSLH